MLVDFSTISNQLREARIDKGLTQAELARELGFRQGTISRAERGLDLRVATLIEIARALDLDLFLAPRRLRPLIQQFATGVERTTQPAIYTGGGDEPYTEVDEPEPERSSRPATRVRKRVTK